MQKNRFYALISRKLKYLFFVNLCRRLPGVLGALLHLQRPPCRLHQDRGVRLGAGGHRIPAHHLVRKAKKKKQRSALPDWRNFRQNAKMAKF